MLQVRGRTCISGFVVNCPFNDTLHHQEVTQYVINCLFFNNLSPKSDGKEKRVLATVHEVFT